MLIALIGKRNIPEIPQGLSDAMKVFAEAQGKLADETMRWADAARLPLPKEFSEGKEAFERFVSLSNPHHVIKEIMAVKEKLPGYVQTIGTSHAFTEKWGTAFTEMRDFAHELSAIQFRLAENGQGACIPEELGCRSFPGNDHAGRCLEDPSAIPEYCPDGDHRTGEPAESRR